MIENNLFYIFFLFWWELTLAVTFKIALLFTSTHFAELICFFGVSWIQKHKSNQNWNQLLDMILKIPKNWSAMWQKRCLKVAKRCIKDKRALQKLPHSRFFALYLLWIVFADRKLIMGDTGPIHGSVDTKNNAI